MSADFDVMVIGSGAGGGTFAYACARAGKSVLLVERGRPHEPVGEGHDEQAMLIDKKPYDDRPVRVNGTPRHLYMGSVPGGGTALYGAALLRPSEDDFHPGKHYGHRLPRTGWDWPIDYQALDPYYTEAENLYEVSGCAEDDFGPLRKPRGAFPRRSPALAPINQRLVAANEARGLRPFRLPLAVDFSRCLRCGVCPGYLCPNGSRRSSAHLAARATAEGLPLTLMTNTEAEGLVKDTGGRVAGAVLRDRASCQRSTFHARRYALAAGAIGSPALLLRSGLGGPLAGRHYMLHLCPVVIGVFRRRTGAEETYVKQVGFHDYYFGTSQNPDKMGVIQSLPVPGPLMVAKAGARLPRPLVQFLRKRMLPLTGIVEDLPNPANRVSLGRGGEVELSHAFAPYDLDRGRELGRLMRKILKNAGALFCLARSFPSEEHVAHHCGTLRFGKDPAHAVLDSDCRLFGQPNVFVVDASVFPTSLGVGPALTIMANALRVADVVTREV
jgi:choline dehydrogenase-like flavoprotein